MFSKATFSADPTLLSASTMERSAFLWDTKTKTLLKKCLPTKKPGYKEAQFSPEWPVIGHHSR